jgi:hypothetical protein
VAHLLDELQIQGDAGPRVDAEDHLQC